MASRGLLLVNLGTPDSPRVPDVRKYLAEFLMDPLVIDLPWPLRAALVYGYILVRRPATSAAAYRKIWTDRGSPLLFHQQDLVAGVGAALGKDWQVAGAMRYGSPSIRTGLETLAKAGVSETVAFPLYPQYSLAASKSSELEIQRWANVLLPGKPLRLVPPFYGISGFLDAFAAVARRELASFAADHVLFSFHGLPERQIKRTDPTGRHCFESDDCCARYVEANPDCYRAQCFKTAQELASRLGLTPERFTVCFQSRLGRTPWIRPFTDVVLRELPSRGVQRVAVMSPAFVSDCLETLEELAIRGAADFKRAGGESLRLIPSLNAEPDWVRTVASLATTTRGP
jgi:ferrochelatase